MSKQKIQQELTTLLLQMGIAPKAITPNASYYKDLGLDSLDYTELIMECEVTFGIAIDCMEMEQITTVQETIDYINCLMIPAQAA